MDALSKLCAKLDYHIARARLWKRAAKRWRYEWYYEQLPRVVRLVDKLLATKADADRRLELLIRAMNALEGWRILLEFPVTDIMRDIEKELSDDRN